MIKYAPFLLFVYFNTAILSAQNWDWAKQYGGENNESIEGLFTDENGRIFIAGSFATSTNIDDNTLESIGERDVYVARLSPTGSVEWIFTGGSEDNDDIADITEGNNGNFYCTGSYWFSANFGDLQFQTTGNSKAIFLLKYDAEGTTLWGKSISGSHFKTIGSITGSLDGGCYITGSFTDSLFLENDTLSAPDSEQLFVIKYDVSGNEIWHYSGGTEGKVRGITIKEDYDGQIIVGGDMQGKAIFNNDTLLSGTADSDVFILKLSATGEAVWGRKAGGVFDSVCEQLAIDNDNNIYVTGTFFGIINLNDSLSIESNFSSEDFFLLKYNSDGAVLWARALGGNTSVDAKDMDISNDQLVLTGSYDQTLILDGIEITNANDQLNGYIATFDLDGNTEKLVGIAGSDFVLSEQVAYTSTGKILAAGVFKENIQFDDIVLTTAGVFDFFLTSYSPEPVNSSIVSYEEKPFTIYPNPAKDILHVQGGNNAWILRDIQGKVWHTGQGAKQFSIRNFPLGVYFFSEKTKRGEWFLQKIIKI